MKLEVVLSSKQRAAFVAALTDDFDSIASSLSKVDARDATSWKSHDVAMIKAAIENGCGFEQLNSTVHSLIRGWIADSGRQALQAMPVEKRGTSVLLGSLAKLLRDQGKLEESAPLFLEALAARRATLGDRHPATLTSMNDLAILRQAQGKLEEAESLFLEALVGRRETLGDRRPDTLLSITNLAGVLNDQGKLGQAEPLYLEALAARRETLGDLDQDTLCSIINLATLLSAQGKLGEAQPLYLEALAAYMETSGDRRPDTLRSINALAVWLRDQGKLDEARPLFLRALSAQRETLGHRHPSTLTSMNDLATLLRDEGDRDEAEPLFTEALTARRATLGDRHPATLTSLNDLATLLRSQGKLGEAGPLFREALAARRETLGDRHPATVASMISLATLLMDQGQLSEAEAMLREGLRASVETMGPDHPNTLATMSNLTAVLQKLGKPSSDADPQLLKLMVEQRRATADEHRKRLGDADPETLRTIDSLASLLARQGRLFEAEGLYHEALTGLQHVKGPRDEEALASLSGLAGVLGQLGKLQEAEKLLRQALLARQEAVGDSHPDTLSTMSRLAAVLESGCLGYNAADAPAKQAAAAAAEAESLLRGVLAAVKKAQGPEHADTLAAACSLLCFFVKSSKLAGVLDVLGTYPNAAGAKPTLGGVLPLHLAASETGSADIVQLLLQAYPDGFSARVPAGCRCKNGCSCDREGRGKLPLELAVAAGAHPAVVELFLAKDPLSLHAIVENDRYADLVSAAVRGDRTLASRSVDAENRPAIEKSTNACRLRILEALYFLARFELPHHVEPHHKSATCAVLFAREHGTERAARGSGPTDVALKFMRHRDQFERELRVRGWSENAIAAAEGATGSTFDTNAGGRVSVDQNLVVPVLRAYKLSEGAREDAESRGLAGGAGYCYLLVMKRAEQDLSAFIEHGSPSVEAARSVAKELGGCLQHMHECGLVHGEHPQLLRSMLARKPD